MRGKLRFTIAAGMNSFLSANNHVGGIKLTINQGDKKMVKNRNDEVVLTEAQISKLNIDHTPAGNDVLSFRVSLPLGNHGKDLEQLSDMVREDPGACCVRVFKSQTQADLDN
jgi:hypothetical protein